MDWKFIDYMATFYDWVSIVLVDARSIGGNGVGF